MVQWTWLTLPSIENDGKAFLYGVLKNLVWLTLERPAMREITDRELKIRREDIFEDEERKRRSTNLKEASLGQGHPGPG